MIFTPTALLLTLALAIPPLTKAEKAQLQATGDRDSRIEAGELYPLLNNAVKWKLGDESGAQIPDYNALFESPADYRGELFLIEGLFNGEDSVRTMDTARDGPWTGKLEQWMIANNAAGDAPLVIYLVNPPPRPEKGAEIRLVGRFYKIWRTKVKNEDGQADYLTFIGHSAAVTGYAPPTDRGSPMTVMFAVVFAMIVAFVFLRMRMSKMGGSSKVEQAATRILRERRGGEEEVEIDDTLPENPVEALDELKRRHETEV